MFAVSVRGHDSLPLPLDRSGGGSEMLLAPPTQVPDSPHPPTIAFGHNIWNGMGGAEAVLKVEVHLSPSSERLTGAAALFLNP